MLIYPAIDLYKGQAVRLYKGDYDKVTVYNDDPLSVAMDFKACGATHCHLVDLEGARDASTPNFDIIKSIKRETGLFCETGGGIRDLATIEKYVNAGIDRVILGTAATNPDFLKEAISSFGGHVAVGMDIRDGYVAISGWKEKTSLHYTDFMNTLENVGVKTCICTDISRDGAMQGANRELYKELVTKWNIDIIASGGVSDMEDIKALSACNLYGAIIGKAYYTKAIDLKEAINCCSQ